MGVDRIVPIQANRSVAKAGKTGTLAADCTVIAFAVWTFASSEILPVQSLSQSLSLSADIEHVSILMPDSTGVDSGGRIAVLIGPEGGWSNDERKLGSSIWRDSSRSGTQCPSGGYGRRGCAGPYIEVAMSHKHGCFPPVY